MNITNKSITDTVRGKTSRIHQHKNRDLKIELEKEWGSFAADRISIGDEEAFSRLFEDSDILKTVIRSIPQSFYKAWKNNSRLTLADFESVAFERAWRFIESYSPHGEWYLYEHLQNGLKQSCIDLLRQQGLTNGRYNSQTAFHTALSTSEDEGTANELASIYDLENDVAAKVSIAQKLNAKEKNVVSLLLTHPKSNTTDICLLLGLNDRKQASRLLESIKKKLSPADGKLS